MDENGDEPVVMTGLAGIPTSEAVPVYDNPGPDEPQEAPLAPPPVGLGIDLHLVPTGPHLRRGLTDALREAVRSGRLGPGTRLPSSRVLAVDLGIARNTVADAYADLVAEGWLTARQGSGTRVAERPVPQRETRGGGHRRAPGKPRYSLLPG
ncbi:GntR family transcriptional regulator, partial [Streptomyces acidiscabies]|uniref:GntR family transcriptional regulator n=1 Tax=Streptomyces acidiscabies TaxID=42234 RepID=UPI000AE59C81